MARSITRAGVSVLLVLGMAVSGCQASKRDRAGEDERIVYATLMLLSASGRTICVDRSTRGDPLVNYRAMIRAPEPARRLLVWRSPTPFQPITMTTGDLVPITVPVGGSALPPLEQSRFDQRARALSILATSGSVAIEPNPRLPGVAPRSWLFGRAGSDCRSVFHLSNPIWSGNLAFITVQNAHEGRTYGLERLDQEWRPMAQSSPWIY